MLLLYLGENLVTLPADTSVKLTRENPYFASAGDYTLELTLPLAGCPANRLALGPLNFPHASRAGLAARRLPMQLVTEAGTFVGHALVTSVDQEQAKLQLIAGRSAFDHAIDGEDRYIDRMDLGKAWDRFEGRLVYRFNGTAVDGSHVTKQFTADSMAVYIRSLFHDTKYSSEAYLMMRGPWPATDSVAFPTYSTAEELVVNTQVSDLVGTSSRCWLPKYDSDPRGGGPTNIRPIAPQPYLLEVIERVIKAAGYTPDLSYFKTHEHPLRYIFIPNVRATFDIARMLPHWTIRQLIENVQDTFGVVFTVDGTTVAVTPRSQWYGSADEAVTLQRVVREFSADIDNAEDAEQKTSSAGNVAYDWTTEDPQLSLPAEVWENADVQHYADTASLKKAAQALTEDQRKLSHTLYVDDTDGTPYAWLHTDGVTVDGSLYRLCPLDQYGPLVREPKARDTFTALPIIPAGVAANGHDIADTWGGGQTITDLFEMPPTSEGHYFTPILVSPDSYHAGDDKYSIDKAINPDSDSAADDTDTAEADKDKMLVAWYDGRSYCFRDYEYGENRAYYDNILCPLGITYMKYNTWRERFYFIHPSQEAPKVPYDEGPFRLRPTADPGTLTLGSALHGAATIDTRIEHEFQFLDRATDPQRPYIINGRRYACHKLELTLTPQGLDPLKRGYFYEITD